MVKVLFVDEDNGSLSQIAAVYLHRIGNKIFDAKSAGINAGSLNPYMLEVMHEKRFPGNQLFTKSIQYFIRREENFQYLIHFLSERESEQSGIFPSAQTVLHWTFRDPKKFEGSENEIEANMAWLFDSIRKEVKYFIRMHMEKMSRAEAVFQV